MYLGYQRYDAHIIDYELYELPGIFGSFRGPPVKGDAYVACVGAAQTFGRFVPTPFPALLARTLGIDALNLGRGGAGPTFPCSDPALLRYINRARLVIVQVFSGRSQSNSLFRVVDHGMMGINLADGAKASANQFYTWLLGQDPQLARQIVAETRENYVQDMTRLLDAIEAPKILFWFSVREPAYPELWQLPIERLWGEFPHFVNQDMVERLRGHSDAYVECVSRRGLPQPIHDRDGNPTSFGNPLPGQSAVLNTVNRYYPSPEMHEEAASLLLPVCRELLSRSRG
jgi:Domain of unknown function (DUF6473)